MTEKTGWGSLKLNNFTESTSSLMETLTQAIIEQDKKKLENLIRVLESKNKNLVRVPVKPYKEVKDDVE